MQIRVETVKRVSCWFVAAWDWMKTSLQSYILYKEQRPIPNEPRETPWPLLNIWNIYAALNFFPPFFFLKKKKKKSSPWYLASQMNFVCQNNSALYFEYLLSTCGDCAVAV